MASGHNKEIGKLEEEVVELTEKVDATAGQVEDVVQRLEALEQKVEELGQANNLWRNNFLIVNKTFSNLRRSGC